MEIHLPVSHYARPSRIKSNFSGQLGFPPALTPVAGQGFPEEMNGSFASAMALSANLFLRQSQSLVMTPQLMQSIQLLQMTHVELSQFIAQEVEKNPLLEFPSDDAEKQAASAAPRMTMRLPARTKRQGRRRRVRAAARMPVRRLVRERTDSAGAGRHERRTGRQLFERAFPTTGHRSALMRRNCSANGNRCPAAGTDGMLRSRRLRCRPGFASAIIWSSNCRSFRPTWLTG